MKIISKGTFFILFFFLLVSAFAQKRVGSASIYSSKAQFELYFSNNINELDQIEGVYDNSGTINNYYNSKIIRTNRFNSDVAIFKNDSNGEFTVIFLDNERSTDMSISSSLDNNTYIFENKFQEVGLSDYTKFVLYGKSNFTIKYFIPIEQMVYDMGRDYVRGTQVSLEYNFIKKFPTLIMHEQAARAREIKEKEIRDQELRKAERESIEASKNAPTSGTGFAVSNKGYILTNYHVIENAKSISITGINQNFDISYKAEIISFDKTADLAILKIVDPKFKSSGIPIPYMLRSSKVEVGEKCFTLGYPLLSSMGMEVKLTDGIVSSRTGYQGDISQYQISTPIQPGNSGGPLFDNKGYIIGIVNAKHIFAENVTYAIKSSYIQNIIDLLPSDFALPNINMLNGKTLPQQVKLISPHIFVVLSNFDQTENTVIRESENSKTLYEGNKTIILNPKFNKNEVEFLVIKRIILDQEKTVIDFEFTAPDKYINGGYVTINKEMYITDGIKKYDIVGTVNIPQAPEKHYFKNKGEKLRFSCIFPKIPLNTKNIDIIEGPYGSFNYFGVIINK